MRFFSSLSLNICLLLSFTLTFAVPGRFSFRESYFFSFMLYYYHHYNRSLIFAFLVRFPCFIFFPSFSSSSACCSSLGFHRNKMHFNLLSSNGQKKNRIQEKCIRSGVCVCVCSSPTNEAWLLSVFIRINDYIKRKPSKRIAQTATKRRNRTIRRIPMLSRFQQSNNNNNVTHAPQFVSLLILYMLLRVLLRLLAQFWFSEDMHIICTCGFCSVLYDRIRLHARYCFPNK